MHIEIEAKDFYTKLKHAIELLDKYKPTLIITKSDEQRLTPEELKKIKEMAKVHSVPDDYLDKNTALLIPPRFLNEFIPKGGLNYDDK